MKPGIRPTFPSDWKGSLVNVDVGTITPKDIEEDALTAVWCNGSGLIEVSLGYYPKQERFETNTAVSVWDGSNWNVRYSDAEGISSYLDPRDQLVESLSLFADRENDEDDRDAVEIAVLRDAVRLALKHLALASPGSGPISQEH